MGGKLRTLRREAGLSQRGLAQKLDLSHQQIQKYERGDNALPLQRVKSFAAALGVAPAILAFPEIDRPVPESAALSPDRAEFLRLYDTMPDRESRRQLLELFRSLGDLVKRLV
jgi:transcriptional regulator with XRE-family HTH domain